MTDDQFYVYGIVAVMAALFGWQVLTKRFDPFAPVWLFLVGYTQVYVIQAITLRDWALGVRGIEVVTAANMRALWALIWFLVVYYSGFGKRVAAVLPGPPLAWSAGTVLAMTPFLLVWGLYCAYVVAAQGTGELTAEGTLFTSFPFVMMVSGVLLVVTGMNRSAPKPTILAAGLCVTVGYAMIWMFNGKRSPALIGVLSTVCVVYVTRQKRPSWPVLFGTAFVGAMFVALSIGWRNNNNYEHNLSGFVQYLGDFSPASILKSLNIDNDEESLPVGRFVSWETLEYGGFLLMMDTVPEKSGYDYGANYIRCFSTYIPRIIWTDKPLYGRDKWVAAWVAGSEMKRNDEFTGPAIGIMGATQLNGGAIGTLIVLAAAAMLQRVSYDYFRLYESVPWVQAWYALSFFNAWFMVVADDPMNWFYFNWGFTVGPAITMLWFVNKLSPAPATESLTAAAT